MIPRTFPVSSKQTSALFAMVVAVAAFCSPRLWGQANQSMPELDRYVESSMKQWQVPGVAIGIVQGSAPIYLKGYGVRNVTTQMPVTPDTLFDIGSCTKAFTAASIAMLVDEKKMNWDDKVIKSIPFFHLSDPIADESVTLRDLLTHRTGLPGADLIWYGTSFPRDEVVRRAAFVRPSTGFRTTFQYQNVMYVALGVAVEHVTGISWDDFVKQRIFVPLGMTESDTSAIDAQRAPDFASPHAERQGKLEVIPWRNIDSAGPAGSINSSVRDMAKWIALQLNDGEFDGKRLISAKNMAEMHQPQIIVPPGEIPTVFFPDSMQLSYGMGWFIQDYRGHQLILHPGDIDGFEALTVLIPEIHTGYEVLVNKGGDSYRQALGYHIADVLLHLPEKDWNAYFKKSDADLEGMEKKQTTGWQSKRNPDAHASHELAAYAATYDNPAYGDVQVKADGDHLTFTFHDVTSPLEHFQYDTFLVRMRPEEESQSRITFNQDADGNISSFDMGGNHFQRQK
jgi:CubicO group peptidase (beta-lactamase class C family)